MDWLQFQIMTCFGTCFALFNKRISFTTLKESVRAMSAINLDKIFYPKSMAIVGTGQLGGHIFSTLVHNLIKGGYSGKIYPVHPDQKSEDRPYSVGL